MAEHEGYDDPSVTGHKQTAAPWLWELFLRLLKRRVEDPCSDSTVFDPEQIGLELTAERLRPKGARRGQAARNALACAVQRYQCDKAARHCGALGIDRLFLQGVPISATAP